MVVRVWRWQCKRNFAAEEGVMMFLIRGEDAFTIDITHRAMCNIEDQGVTELGAFRRLVETLRIKEKP